MCQVKFRNYCLQMEGILSFTLQMLGKGYHLYRKSCIEHPIVWGEELGDRFILNNRYEWGATFYCLHHTFQRKLKGIFPKLQKKWTGSGLCITVLIFQHHLYPHSVILLDIAQQVSNKWMVVLCWSNVFIVLSYHGGRAYERGEEAYLSKDTILVKWIY